MIVRARILWLLGYSASTRDGSLEKDQETGVSKSAAAPRNEMTHGILARMTLLRALGAVPSAAAEIDALPVRVTTLRDRSAAIRYRSNNSPPPPVDDSLTQKKPAGYK